MSDQRTAGTMPPSYTSTSSGSFSLSGLFGSLFGSPSWSSQGGNYAASRPSLNTEQYGPWLPTQAASKPAEKLANGYQEPASYVWNGVLGVFDKALDFVGEKIEFERYKDIKKLEVEADAQRRSDYAYGPAAGSQPILAGVDPFMLLALGVGAFLLFKK